MQNFQKKHIWIFIPLLFLLFSAPAALDYVFHYPDEKYYTDAVLQMMDHGDYLTPYSADGSYRFLKPIVTYWVLMVSYKLFGISVLSSRLFFWLAGAMLVAITFFMAKSLTKNRKIAFVAAFITAANPLVLLSSARSIPDILLVLFLTVSAWGFLEILTREKPAKLFYWMAYLGAAIAFETKGLPAAVFAGISFLYILFNPWQRKKIGQLLEPFSLISAIIVAFGWFVAMYAIHGPEYLGSFFADQVGDRVSSKVLLVLKNSALGIINLILFTIPWIFIAFSKPGNLKNRFSESGEKMKAIIGFIAVWVIMTILMSGAVFKFYDRYLLPVIPLASLFLAMILARSETRFIRFFLHLFAGATLAVLVVNALYALFILPDKILILGTVAGIFAVSIWKFNGFRRIPDEILLANFIMLLYFSVHVLLYPLLMPNPGEQLTENIKAEQSTGTETIYVYGNIRTASNIRIHSRHRMDVVSMDTVYTLPSQKNHLLVFSPKEQPFLDLENYTVFPGSEEWKRVPVDRFSVFLQPVVEKIKASGTKYYIAKPN